MVVTDLLVVVVAFEVAVVAGLLVVVVAFEVVVVVTDLLVVVDVVLETTSITPFFTSNGTFTKLLLKVSLLEIDRSIV